MLKRLSTRYRIRLVMALPIIALCFTLAAGLYPLLMIEPLLSQQADLRSMIPSLKITVLLTSATAAIIAGAIAVYIARPVRKITNEMKALAQQPQLGVGLEEGENEIEALTRVYNQAFVPLKGQLASADLFMQMSEGILGLDREGNIAILNSQLENLLQIDRASCVGRNYRVLFPNDTKNFEISNVIQEALSGVAVDTRDIVVTTPDGHDVYLKTTASPASGRKQELMGAVLLFKGFEEFGRLKDNLRRMDALAALGGSVTGMAHEVRTPIGYIRSLAELLREDLPKDSRQFEYVTTIIDSADRLNLMVGNILSLAKVKVDNSSSEDVVTLLREAIAYSRNALQPKNLKLVEDYPQQAYVIKADRDRMIECFINLFNNACEASVADGTVSVRVRPITVGKRSATSPHTIMVEFHNHGSAIAPEDLESLFVPFFTTKKQGTGLGLAISKQIIESHGGAIRVESDYQKGTLFRVLLPA